MTTLRTAQVGAPGSAGLSVIIFKSIDTLDHNAIPSAQQAGLDALTGFRFKDRLSYNQYAAMLSGTPGLLFGAAYVVTLPNDVTTADITGDIVVANTVALQNFRFFFSDPAMLTNLFGGCAAIKNGIHVGGLYDPETLGGMTGGSEAKVWP